MMELEVELNLNSNCTYTVVALPTCARARAVAPAEQAKHKYRNPEALQTFAYHPHAFLLLLLWRAAQVFRLRVCYARVAAFV